MMHRPSYYVINAITMYRLLAAPVVALLIVYNQYDIFKWMLALSFGTDLIDGWLARRFKVTSVFGSKLDSVADDLTVAAAITGVILFKHDFLVKELWIIISLLVLFMIQVALALARYKRLTSFHTYSAKAATILQGSFFILLFFLPQPLYPLFYITAAMTAIDLLEEIVLVLLLRDWKVNVKGLYWVLRKRELASR